MRPRLRYHRSQRTHSTENKKTEIKSMKVMKTFFFSNLFIFFKRCFSTKCSICEAFPLSCKPGLVVVQNGPKDQCVLGRAPIFTCTESEPHRVCVHGIVNHSFGHLPHKGQQRGSSDHSLCCEIFLQVSLEPCFYEVLGIS